VLVDAARNEEAVNKWQGGIVCQQRHTSVSARPMVQSERRGAAPPRHDGRNLQRGSDFKVFMKYRWGYRCNEWRNFQVDGSGKRGTTISFVLDVRPRMDVLHDRKVAILRS
jgi:hypothetical protein